MNKTELTAYDYERLFYELCIEVYGTEDEKSRLFEKQEKRQHEHRNRHND